MKEIFLLFVFLLVISTNTSAQKSLFKMYRLECSELFGIDVTRPKGFKVIKGLTPFKVNEKRNLGAFYQMVLESKDKDCLILYPYFLAIDNDVVMRNMAYEEVKAAMNLSADKNLRMKVVDGKFMIQGMKDSKSLGEIASNSVPSVGIIAKENMEEYFNADTVFIYKVLLPQPYKGIYSECIGINVFKKGRPSAMIKLLLTSEGKKKEEEYMQILFRSIHYGDSMPDYEKNKRKAYKKHKFRSFFHGKQYDTLQ